jgi:hypothetical protein
VTGRVDVLVLAIREAAEGTARDETMTALLVEGLRTLGHATRSPFTGAFCKEGRAADAMAACPLKFS